MKQIMVKILANILLLFLLVLFSACNNTLYEIEEVEEVVDIKEEVKSPTANTDLKEEVKPPPEDRTDEPKSGDKEIVSKTYIIQIGAFNVEENAAKFTTNAKSRLSDSNIYYKNINGLYKVRLGNFVSKQEAISFLEKIQGSGFNDSFVVELTYVKTEK
jgi:cell division protein FtsN